MSCTMPPISPPLPLLPGNAEGCLPWNTRNLKLQVGKTGIVSFQSQQRVFTSEWDLRHFLWEDKRRHTPEPRTVLAPLGRQGVGGGRVSLCPFSGIPLTLGKPGFLDKRCSLCVLSEALSDLVSTEEIVQWKETSRFFFSLFKRCSIQECEVTVQWASRWWMNMTSLSLMIAAYTVIKHLPCTSNSLTMSSFYLWGWWDSETLNGLLSLSFSQ